MKKISLLLASLLLFASPSYAMDIKEAKAQGLVGERNDGYVGYVTDNRSAEVMALVKSINNKRKTKFEKAAAKAGASSEQVALRFYHRAVEATKPNHYYQNESGDWVKK